MRSQQAAGVLLVSKVSERGIPLEIQYETVSERFRLWGSLNKEQERIHWNQTSCGSCAGLSQRDNTQGKHREEHNKFGTV